MSSTHDDVSHLRADDVSALRADNADLARRVLALEKATREMSVSLARTQGWLGMIADGHTLVHLQKKTPWTAKPATEATIQKATPTVE